MNTRDLVDPEVAPLLDVLPGFDFTLDNIIRYRAEIARMSDGAIGFGPVPRVQAVPGHEGAPPVVLYIFDPVDAAAKRPGILHIHGGGMVLGSAKISSLSLGPIIEQTGAVAVSVEYRLAPETPFPGPLHDCYAGLQWMVAHSEELRIDPRRIIILGDSAGGGLAAAVALMARDLGEIHLAGQVLVYPMIDHRTGGPVDSWSSPVVGEFIWTRANNQFGWDCLRGNYRVGDARKGLFSPSLAEDLALLPPTFISVGALDLFVHEDAEYARRLTAARVPVEFHMYPGAPHAFDLMPAARVTLQANRDKMDAIRRFCGI